MKLKKRYWGIGGLLLLFVIYLCYSPSTKLKGELTHLDLNLTDNSFYLEEENYESQMKNEVQPFIDQYQTDAYFETDEGITIHYQAYELPDSIGTIAISHGFTESMHKYEEVIYYFLKSGYSVYGMDHRGHGLSTRLVDDPSLIWIDDFDLYVSDFSIFISEIVLPKKADKPLYLFAHSMGGAIGARVLEEHPEFFDKAILSSPMMAINSGMPWNLTKFIANTAVLFGQGKHYLPGHFSFDGVRDYSTFSATSEARFNYIFDHLLEDEQCQTYGGSYSWLKNSIQGITKLLDKENLNKITTPILLFQAGNDSLVKPVGHYTFVNQVASSQFIYVPDAKHELYNAENEIMIPYYNTIFEFLTDSKSE